MVTDAGGGWSCCISIYRQESGRDQCLHSAGLLLSIQPRTVVHGMVQPTFGMGLPSLVQFLGRALIDKPRGVSPWRFSIQSG